MSSLHSSLSSPETAQVGVPRSLTIHAAAVAASVQRVRTALTGFSTPVALERAYADAAAAQSELAATLAEMDALLHPNRRLAA
jgi:hypothetical protein